MRARGIRVIVQDRNPLCPGAALADAFVEADTCDAQSAEKAATDFHVDAVLTAGTDQPVHAAACAARKRGCPSFLSPDQSLALTDKEVMKDTLVAAGIPVPRYLLVDSGDSASCLTRLKAPYVIKPVDSQGQRGVLKFSEPSAFEDCRNESLAWSRRGKLIVEEYQKNREVTVSGWVHNGALSIWAITDRVTHDFAAHIGICLAHRYPSAYAAGVRNDIRQISERCVHALGIRQGPIYFQLFVTDNGILVNETAARLGGAYEDISLPAVAGVDPISLLIAGAQAGYADPDNHEFAVPLTASSFAVSMPFCRPGLIQGTDPAKRVRILPGVTAFEYLLKPGTLVRPTRNSVQRAAYTVIHGRNVSEVNRIVKRSFARMNYYDREGRQLLNKSVGYVHNPVDEKCSDVF